MGSRQSGIHDFSAVIAVVLAAAALNGCVREINPVTGRRQFYAYSWEQEQQIGEQANVQITEQLGLYDNDELQNYVDRIGQQVLASSELRQEEDLPQQFQAVEFHFKVMDSSVVNAFALPGGYIYVTRGLLAHLQNEAQLAVVLGHEIAHVVARHSSQQMLRARTAQLGLFAGAIIGSEVFDSPALAHGLLQLGGQAAQLLLLKYSRDAELEADELGVQYALAQGYEASEASGFFHTLERISAEQGAMLPTWQSTHPDPGDRRESMHTLSDAYRDQPPEAYRVRQEQYLRQIDNMIFGDDPQQGYVQDNQFYHPKLQFQFMVPPNWQLQNQHQVVLMRPTDAPLAMALEVTEAASAAAAAQQLINSGQVHVIEGRRLVINDLPAFQLRARSGERQSVDLLVTFLELQQRVYAFTVVGSPPAFRAYRPLFTQVLASFAPLTDADKLSVQPTRLQIVAAQRQAPLQQLLPEQLPPDVTPEQVAILNQRQLDEVIPAGWPLKIPVRR